MPKYYEELTEAQKQFILKSIDVIYETFVSVDDNLSDSTCSCCIDKRDFLRMLLETK